MSANLVAVAMTPSAPEDVPSLYFRAPKWSADLVSACRPQDFRDRIPELPASDDCHKFHLPRKFW
jgi:hypothetical protein